MRSHQQVRSGPKSFDHRCLAADHAQRRGGRAPEPGNLDQLYRLGQLLGRLHAVGSTRPFEHREALGVKNFGHDSLTTLLEGNFIPKSLLPAYESVARDLLKRVEEVYKATPHKNIRMHGDCHPGNLLWTDAGCHFVDLDDAVNGPAVQDFWMLLSGERAECEAQIAGLIEGYREFGEFDTRELALIEPLRALRQIHYAAWLARRWEDPAFPPAFPWFASPRYWEEHVLALRECLAALGEPPLSLWD